MVRLSPPPPSIPRSFSQRLVVPHVVSVQQHMGVFVCMGVCICVCVCVCVMSRMVTRLTQHPLASHDIPFGRSRAGASPCSAAGTSNRIAPEAGGRVRVGGRDLETRPGSKKRGPNQQLDPAAQLTKYHPPPSDPARPLLFLSRAGRHRWSSRGGPLLLPSPSGRRGQSAAAEPNSNPFGIVHAGGRGWLAVRASARLIAHP